MPHERNLPELFAACCSECGHEWDVFAPEGVEVYSDIQGKVISIECPECGRYCGEESD